MANVLLLVLAGVIVYVAVTAVLCFVLKRRKHRIIVLAIAVLLPVCLVIVLSQRLEIGTGYVFPVATGQQKENVDGVVRDAFGPLAFERASDQLGLSGRLTYADFRTMLMFDPNERGEDAYVVHFISGNHWRRTTLAAKRIADAMAEQARVQVEAASSEPPRSTAAAGGGEGEDDTKE